MVSIFFTSFSNKSSVSVHGPRWWPGQSALWYRSRSCMSVRPGTTFESRIFALIIILFKIRSGTGGTDHSSPMTWTALSRAISSSRDHEPRTIFGSADFLYRWVHWFGVRPSTWWATAFHEMLTASLFRAISTASVAWLLKIVKQI